MKIVCLTIGIFYCFSFLSSCKKGKNNSEACNGDARREVKLMTDERTALVDTTPVFTTIEELNALDVPDVKSETDRQDMELKTYTVIGTVVEVDRKSDGDYHILLKSGDKYLITEVPNPDCDHAEGSAYNAIYAELVAFIEENDLEGKEIEVTGVAFVDIDHHYSRKQADNNIELHPILRIRF